MTFSKLVRTETPSWTQGQAATPHSLPPLAPTERTKSMSTWFAIACLSVSVGFLALAVQAWRDASVECE
jgi:hypothetical protein